MHFKPEDFNEPFGPIYVCADGARTAIPSDFRGHIHILETMAQVASNVVLRARLCDVIWLLDRKRVWSGLTAITAYEELIRMCERGILKFKYLTETMAFHRGIYQYLLRALTIARSMGWNKSEFDSIKNLLVDIRKNAINKGAPIPLHWFSRLDLRVGVSKAKDVATDLKTFLENIPTETDHHIIIDLWQLKAQAYKIARENDDMYQCKMMAADAMVAMADLASSAMLAAQFIGNAITALHGVPNTKNRRQLLRQRLLDVQAGIADELTTYTREADLSELIARTQTRVTQLNLKESLFIFAGLHKSPHPDTLQADAIEAIRQTPLRSLFSNAHVDDEGKVVHRTSAKHTIGEFDESVILEQIARTESLHRSLIVATLVEAARRTIMTQHYISDDIFIALLSYSPFVPQDLLQTFARGFSRFFQGDFTSAIYILTPLLENSLRHILKHHGNDVTIFDDATQTQRDRSISLLFDQMRAALDLILTHSITADIERVFLSKPGPQIRHAIAHGLLSDNGPSGTDAIYGSWLIFRLCLLPLFPHFEKIKLPEV
jgi:hypothetical protein